MRILQKMSFSVLILLLGFLLGISALQVYATSEVPDQSPDGGTVIPNFQGLVVGNQFISQPALATIAKVGAPVQGLYVSGLNTAIEAVANFQAISANTQLPTGANNGAGVNSTITVSDANATGFAFKGKMSGAFGYGLTTDQESTSAVGGAAVRGKSRNQGNDDKAVTGFLGKRETGNGLRAGVWGELANVSGVTVAAGLAVEKDGRQFGLFTDLDAKIGRVLTDSILGENSHLDIANSAGDVRINDAMEVVGSSLFSGGVDFNGAVDFNSNIDIAANDLKIDGKPIETWIRDKFGFN